MDAIDPFDLDRFVAAQRPIWLDALAELLAGRKHGHWMWFVFPQIAGLGQSNTARFYAIRSLAEARAYLAHPVLGMRLIEAIDALLHHPHRSPEQILGTIDAVKLRSSLTLFEAAFEAAEAGAPFEAALRTFYAGVRDLATLRLIER